MRLYSVGLLLDFVGVNHDFIKDTIDLHFGDGGLVLADERQQVGDLIAKLLVASLGGEAMILVVAFADLLHEFL